MSTMLELLRDIWGPDADDMRHLPSQRMKAMQARIEALEAGITAALRERDDEMRPILREALHGREGE